MCILLFLIAGIPIRASHYQEDSLSAGSVSQNCTIKKSAQIRRIIYKGNRNFPPYEFINDKGEPDGFNVDLIKYIFERMGVQYSIELKNWSSSLSDLINHKADVVSLMYSNVRAKKYKFGPTIKYTTLCAVYIKNRSAINTIQDIKGRKLVLEKGTYSNELVLREGIYSGISYVQNLSEGLILLSKGHFDVMLCEGDAAKYYINKYGLLNLMVKDIGITPIELCFAGNDEQMLDCIAKVFYMIRKDGSYDRIYNKWFNEYGPTQLSYIIYFIVFLLLVVVLILYVVAYLLRKKIYNAKKQLLNQNNRLKLVLSAGGIIVWGFDVIHKKYYNIDCDMFPPEGRAFEDEVAMFHPDDQQAYRELILKASVGILPERPVCFRIDYTKTDNWRYIEKIITVARDGNGDVISIIGTHRDVTDLIISQRREQEAVEKAEYAMKSADLSFWEFDVKTQLFKSYNDRFNNYNTSNLMDAFKLKSFIHPDDIQQFIDQAGYILKGENKSFAVNFRAKLPSDEDWHYFNTTCTPFEIDKKTGLVIKYVGMRKDNTDLIRIQHRLEQEKIKAQESDRLKSEFLANMSHEIRTPLNAIVGFSRLIDEIEDKSEREECKDLIDRNSDVLLNLISDILDFSKMESGSMDFHVTEVNLTDLFKVSHSSLMKLSRNSNVEFICDVPANPCIVQTDYNRIMQILTNFVTNAFKYTDKGYVKMSYRCVCDGIKLSVEDTGAGIPEAYQSKVFERFEKLNSFKQGVGLGLPICKAIVERCGGKIGVVSEIGVGSTFWVWLPLNK